MIRQKGFSLVQVIVSLGLVSGLFVVALKIFQNQTELGKSSSFHFESLVVMDEIKSILADPFSCSETLKNLSAIFDEVIEIKHIDPVSKNSDAVFAIHSAQPKALGQKNVFLQSMTLNGEKGGFSSSNGFTTLNFIFSEKPTGGESFKTSFPLRVGVNDLGRIIRCQARPGIHQENSARSLNDPWAKVKNGAAGEISGIAVNDKKVVIGNISALGSLNVEGGLLLYSRPEDIPNCSAELLGNMSFDSRRQVLQVCNHEGKWVGLHDDQVGFGAPQSFTYKSKNSSPVTESTNEAFAFCRLEKLQGDGGICSASPVNPQESLSQWEFMIQHFNGSELTCLFNCYK